MEDMIEKMKKLNKYSQASDVAKKVIEIIDADEKKCRYSVGNDASFLIDSFYLNKDDCKKMDNDVLEIMAKYFQ